MFKEKLVYLIITITLTLIIILTRNADFFNFVELKAIDLRASVSAKYNRPKKNLPVLAITDKCIEKAGSWPFYRSWYAFITDWASTEGVKGIMFDLIFSGSGSKGARDHELFLNTLKKSAEKIPLIMGCDMGFQEILDPETWETITVFDLDNSIDFSPALKGSVNMGNLEHMNPDSILRYVPLVFKNKDKIIPSLAFAMYLTTINIKNPVIELSENNLIIKDNEKSKNKILIPCIIKDLSNSKEKTLTAAAYTLLSRLPYLKGSEYIEISSLLPGALNNHALKLIKNNQLSRAREILQKAIDIAEKNSSFSEKEILQNNLNIINSSQQKSPDKIPFPDCLKNSIITVMGTGTGLFDLYPSSIDSKKIPGGWVHTSLLRQLLEKTNISLKNSDSINLILIISAGFIGFLILIVKCNFSSFLLFSVTALLFTFVSFRLFINYILINMTLFLSALFLIYSIGSSIKLVIFQKKERELKSIFSRYVSPEVAGKIIMDKDRISLSGDRYNASVLFLDVCSFTSFSEKHDPEAVFSNLNRYFSFITDIIFEHKGTLDKFIGDAVMAVFGVPLECKDHALSALECALKIQKTIQDYNQESQFKDLCLNVSIGIASGDMAAGNIGSKKRMDYTVIGDTVNLAARLEAKAGPGEIIISHNTYLDLISKNNRENEVLLKMIKPLLPFKVKGKENDIQAYSINYK
jgi:class 3 adenylate cyclase/CHASE2 domain-containing sensor protein